MPVSLAAIVGGCPDRRPAGPRRGTPRRTFEMTAQNALRPDVPARRRTLASAVMAGAALLLAAVAAHAQDAHGAIAFGQVAQGGAVAYGLAYDYAARDDAEDAAVNACLDGGGSDCAVLAWFQNGCGALAIDQYGMAQGKGARSLDRAEARVLQTCEVAGGVGCAVVVSQCVSPDGRPDTWSGSESVLAPPDEDPVRQRRRVLPPRTRSDRQPTRRRGTRGARSNRRRRKGRSRPGRGIRFSTSRLRGRSARSREATWTREGWIAAGRKYPVSQGVSSGLCALSIVASKTGRVGVPATQPMVRAPCPMSPTHRAREFS